MQEVAMSLRMVEMVIPQTAAVDGANLSEAPQILGLWREPLHDGLMLLRVLVPCEKTEAVIKELESKFQMSPGFRLIIFGVEATLPQPEVEEVAPDTERNFRDPVTEEAEEKRKDPQRIACTELVQKLAEGATASRVYLAAVVLSAVVAAIGLIRDNAAAIIGAMVIAPLLGPNMTLSLATTLGDSQLARKALRVNLTGLSLALIISAALGLVVTVDPSASEIARRTDVALSDVALALAAGSAGALAFTTGLSTALVGVMVAVALLPPLAATGLLLGAGQWQPALGALLLTVTNIICINLAGVGTFLWQGVQPRHWWEAERAKRMTRIAGLLWVLLLAVLVVLIVVGNR
jgi:uncharacterized hydrophobic protein (TIGR00341 family)